MPPSMQNPSPAGFSEHENLRSFCCYVASLDWTPGHLDKSSWSAALRAASLGIEQNDVFALLCRLIETAGDVPKMDKIRSQIHRAREYIEACGCDDQASDDQNPAANAEDHQPLMRGHQRTPKVQAEFQPAILRQSVNAINLADVESFIQSRSVLTPEYITSGRFLAELYHPGEKVLVFTRQESQGQIWEVDHYPACQGLPRGGPDGVLYLVQPVDGLEHPNPRQGGKLSRRSQESVTSFRFLQVAETSFAGSATAVAWAACCMRLPFRGTLASCRLQAAPPTAGQGLYVARLQQSEAHHHRQFRQF